MANLNNIEIKKIAYLARLAINDSEVKNCVAELSKILELIEKINVADTEDITPMAHPLNIMQRLREDEVTQTDQSALLQKNAPKTEKKIYLVPPVIE